ncbi:M12 family metallo-peptidase [Methanogenium organophilum]|uniref:M12 family metallo-peptidase n=1 Tax=Methanogenium organophilum TaxID=2199 RepID=A0A9X9S4D6_METOG|nr:M12 family metallo-peptidase [Methanogenium organophilum]WAI01456.1 M12 family metallo-peptidase [Methanogenium organophilum]
MKPKIEMRALSVLLALLFVSVIVVPAVSALDSEIGNEQMHSESVGKKALVHFGDMTEIRITDERTIAKIPSSIKNYDLVVFDIQRIREILLSGDTLTVYVEGQPYVMDIQEILTDTEALAIGIHSFTGSLIGVEDSEVILTFDDRVLLSRIAINKTEYYIESTSMKDPKSTNAFLQYVYSSKDVVPEGDTILIDSYLPSTHVINETEYALKKILEEQAYSDATVTVRVLVATDSKWMTDEPDWQVKAANIITDCNYEMNTIGVNLVPIYDTSKAQLLSDDPQIQGSPLSTFAAYYPKSYLNSKSADFGLYLGGFDSTSNGVGSSGGYDHNTLYRHAWTQMADDPSTYDAVHKDRAVVTLHEIGHVFDADHDPATGQTETYNRPYRFYEHYSYWQTVMWGYFMKSNWLEFSADDGYYGDANHDNERRISETKGVVASYC